MGTWAEETKEEDSWSSEAGRLRNLSVSTALLVISCFHRLLPPTAPLVYRGRARDHLACKAQHIHHPAPYRHSSQTPAQEKETSSNTVTASAPAGSAGDLMAERVGREP